MNEPRNSNRCARSDRHSLLVGSLAGVKGILVSGIAATVIVASLSLAEVTKGDSAPLFRIERSKNANIVQYDAVVLPDGTLDPEKPIDAYWLKLASDGSRKELSWLQKQSAYGFTTRWRDNGSVLEMDMAAAIKRPVEIVRDGDRWRARCRIDGRAAWIERIFVQSEPALVGRRIVHLDFEGTDIETLEQRSERLMAE